MKRLVELKHTRPVRWGSNLSEKSATRWDPRIVEWWGVSESIASSPSRHWEPQRNTFRWYRSWLASGRIYLAKLEVEVVRGPGQASRATAINPGDQSRRPIAATNRGDHGVGIVAAQQQTLFFDNNGEMNYAARRRGCSIA